jgi:hypothetical protein
MPPAEAYNLPLIELSSADSRFPEANVPRIALFILDPD